MYNAHRSWINIFWLCGNVNALRVGGRMFEIRMSKTLVYIVTVQHHVWYSAWVQTGVINHCWLQIWILARIKCSELLDCRPVHPSCLLSIDCRFQYSTLVVFPGKKLSKKKKKQRAADSATTDNFCIWTAVTWDNCAAK